jgi:hypothetical protein
VYHMQSLSPPCSDSHGCFRTTCPKCEFHLTTPSRALPITVDSQELLKTIEPQKWGALLMGQGRKQPVSSRYMIGAEEPEGPADLPGLISPTGTSTPRSPTWSGRILSGPPPVDTPCIGALAQRSTLTSARCSPSALKDRASGDRSGYCPYGAQSRRAEYGSAVAGSLLFALAKVSRTLCPHG